MFIHFAFLIMLFKSLLNMFDIVTCFEFWSKANRLSILDTKKPDSNQVRLVWGRVVAEFSGVQYLSNTKTCLIIKFVKIFLKKIVQDSALMDTGILEMGLVKLRTEISILMKNF